MKMQKTKRNRRDITLGDGFGKSCERSSSALDKQIVSEVSESVVSLASFVGDTMQIECTGIFIESLCADATSILTSSTIVGSSDDDITDKLRIEVCLPNHRVVIGRLHHCDFKYDLAVVNISRERGFQEAHLSSSYRVQYKGKVVAVGPCFNSGMLKTTNGIVIGGASKELCELILYRYNINTAWIGCPLIDFDGNFVGLNLRSGDMTAFTPINKILECLGYSGAIRVGSNQGGVGAKESSTTKAHNAVMPPDDDVFQMRVMYSFEEEFEDNIWSTLSEDVASAMSECVVSLASFNGDTRCFACTGVFIGCNPMRILTSASLVRISGDGNKIDHNLRIQVCLNNKRHVTGTLKHCDLSYNVAVVEIMGSCCSRAVELEKHISFTPNSEVVAIGCRFKHRKLMASRGVLIDRKSKLACEELRISTCEITKAGIGGPLIDTYGNFIGMNFFHEEETPYLPREKIQEALRYFDDEWHNFAGTDEDGGSDSWPVPKQYWCYPPFCVNRHRRFYTKEEADAALPPRWCLDQPVYDTEEDANTLLTPASWC